MNNEILSASKIEEIESELNKFKNSVEQYVKDVETVFNKFKTAQIPESFFKPGNFGQQQEERIINLVNSLNKYMNVINNSEGLIPKTQQLLNQQKDLLERGEF